VYLCTDELPENLRSLSPQSDLLRERFKSLQKRNFVEVTVPVKFVLSFSQDLFNNVFSRSYRILEMYSL
jgi:hypothetical protein